ncbi:MAG: acetylhydrolase [Alphaproteobacteria bacterium]|nr:acetylhydrolase [Alphaproteobacteria bacterium]
MIARRALLATPLLARPAAAFDTRAEWHDPLRSRRIPVLIRLPDTPPPHPLVLISHGLGGTRDGLAYLGEALRAAGCIALHLQHPGSDADTANLRNAVADPDVALARLADGAFALDQAARMWPLRANAIAAAGHSFGAWTVQHWLGQRLGPQGLSYREPRIRLGIAISPAPTRRLAPAFAMAGVDTPMLHITGSRDTSPLDQTTPQDRTLPFRATPDGVPAALLWLDGADHMSFAGDARFGTGTHARVAGVAVMFLRAMLLADQGARGRLLAGARGLLRQEDRLETRAIA